MDSNDEGHVRMHDVIRDFCIDIAKQKGCIGGNDCAWISSSQRVGERAQLLTESRFPNLHLLSLEGKEFVLSRHEELEFIPPHEEFEFGSSFLEGIKDLHVLCIKRYWGLTSVPPTTPSLVNLKTLLLDSCWRLETISVVGKLRNLEILICRGCELIKELPLEMKGLNRLKLLDLSSCLRLQSIGRGIISSLVGLEELKMLCSFNKWEAEDREERENAALRELEALTNLSCLEIEIEDPLVAAENMHLSSKLERFYIKIARPCRFITQVDLHHKLINLRLDKEICLGDWNEMELLRDTEGLYLYGNGANNVDLAKCQNIHSLVVLECKTMKSIIRTPFPLIEYLYLCCLPELEEICDGPILSNSFEKLKNLEVRVAGLKQFWKSSSQNNYFPLFSNLSSIEIRLCHRIRNLGQLSVAGKDCLPQLEQLHISKCEMMEQVFLWNDEETGENKNSIESQQNRHVITKVFPKLKEVVLVSLPNLTTFYLGIEGIEFPLLTKLQIQECPKMKSIVIAGNANSLREITSSSADIDHDDSLHLFCQSGKELCSSLEVLRINHNPFCGHEIPSSIFNGLEELTINEYEGSRSLLTLSVAANLVSLRELYLSKCDKMIKVIEDEEQQERFFLFPKLEILEFKNLPKLVSFCDWKCEVEWPSLNRVKIEQCPNMKNFSLGLLVTPKLEAFTTDLTTHVGVGDNVSFDNVKTLVIKENENPLYHHEISVYLFNGLEKIEFNKYKGDMSLLSSSAVRNLVNLRVLRIEVCNEIVKVIEDEEEEEDDVTVVSGGEIRTVLFPKLEELHFSCLHKLVSFCKWKCDIELPSLRVVSIDWCDKMEIFSLGIVAAPNLERVAINNEYIDGATELNGAMQQYLAQKEERLRRMEEEGGEEEQEQMDEIEEEEDDHN